MARLYVAALFFILQQACGPNLPAGFVSNREAAEQAYSLRHYEKSALHWESAARAADRVRDRDEAQYRAAQSWLRAGKPEPAHALLQTLAAGSGERAPSAALALAENPKQALSATAGAEALLHVALRFPNAGVSRGALRRYLAWFSENNETAPFRAELERLARLLKQSYLKQDLEYQRARLLEQQAEPDAARRAYLELARAYPYPQGAYWDDALWHAAKLEERGGSVQRAVELLEELLSARESSAILGSYEKTRYADARFHIAVLYRDRLNRPDLAERHFERLWYEHEHSRMRDDALWEAAKLKRARGDERGACATLATLQSGAPDSRYAACAPLLCASSRATGICHQYIVRELSPHRE